MEGLSATSEDYVAVNGAKRRRLDDDLSKPSSVLHIRGLPSDVTESEVVEIAQPFGDVKNVILTRNKNQALLEMEDLSSAQAMVEYYSQQPGFVRQSSVVIQFSNHSTLKADGESSAVDGSRCILHVTVDNMIYPITIDMLKQIFSTYGNILRIITFNKNNSFQALVQYSDAAEAQKGKLSLNGHNIFNGCCKLHIEYSKLKNLSVRYNNDKSRDYTNTSLPSGDGGGGGGGGPPFSGQDKQMTNYEGNPSILGTHYYPDQAGVPSLMSYMSNQTTTSIYPMASPYQSSHQAHPAFASTTSVILVSNLNETKATPDALFTLFGVYGEVVRVKILFNKKDTALIQYKDSMQAQLALTHLDYVKLWGKQVKLSSSKFRTVQMPKDGTPDAQLTQDYSNSPWHRVRRSSSTGGRSAVHIVSPSDTLHLSNIPQTVTEDDMKKLFCECGTVVDFKFMERLAAAERKMALIQMSSTEEAVEALVSLHNTDFANSCRLCVSFTKSIINHLQSS